MAQNKQRIETELATYVQRNDKKDEEEEAKENEPLKYCQIENLDIFLGDITRTTNLAKIQKYEYYMRVWMLLVIPSIMVAVIWDETSTKLIPMVFASLMMVFCVGALLFAMKHQNDSKSVLNHLNYILGIPDRTNGDGLYDIETQYYGIVYMCCCLYISLNYILYYSLFGVDFSDRSFHEYVDDQPNEIIILAEQTIGIYIFWAMGIIISSTYYTIHPTFDSKIQEEKNKLLDRYKHTNIKSIENGILEALAKHKEGKKPQNRKLGIIFDLLGAIIYRLCISYIFPGTLFNTLDGLSIGHGKRLMITYIMIMDIIFFSFFFFFVRTLYFYHYRFIYDIMDQFTLSVESKKVDDVIAWWELRKFYIYCIGFYVSGLSSYVLSALFAAFVNIASGLYFISLSPPIYGFAVSNAMIISYLAVLIFTGTELCVSYHNMQLHHVTTLNKERLQFLKYDMANLDRLVKIFDVLGEDITCNDFPLSLLGVRMNSNFMLFLRGAAITIVIGILVELSN